MVYVSYKGVSYKPYCVYVIKESFHFQGFHAFWRMANTTAQGEASTSSNEVIESNHVSSSQQKPPRHFKFPAHHDHMLSLAKMCKENKQFADCIIQSDNGLKHHAHRLVLGASSSFLTMIFQQVNANSSASQSELVLLYWVDLPLFQ